MRQSISTRYIGPTDHRGSRVKARASGGFSRTIGWDDRLDSEANHTAAARELAARLGWAGRWVGGGSADGQGYVFVQDDGDGFTVER
jgi:hypothetical protein